MEYPKINSLYKRQEYAAKEPGRKHNPLIIGDFACDEFASVLNWTITEKVDGTNIRIIFDRSKEGYVDIRGRTDRAQIPPHLLKYLQETFTWQKLDEAFKESNYTVLFGEGYGPKIQSGGYYRKDASFILFDVYCSGWWMKRQGVFEAACKLEIDPVPLIMNEGFVNRGTSVTPYWTVEEIYRYVKSKPQSVFSEEDHEMEGVVARSEPLMLFRDGKPVMFKLKCCDL